MLEEALTIAHGTKSFTSRQSYTASRGLTLQQSRVKASRQGKASLDPESERRRYFRQAIEIARHQSHESLRVAGGDEL